MGIAKSSHFKAIILIAACGAIVYANSLGNSFVWDDESLIVENCYIKSWRHLPRTFCIDLYHGTWEPSNYYRPIQAISYMADYSLWRLNQKGFHLTSLLLHILCAAMVYLLVNRIAGDRRLSLIAGVFFVVHPVHTASVAYISGRADLLVGLFLLASIYLFIKSFHPPSLKPTICYIGSLLAFVFALLSKEIAIILPLMVILYDLTFDMPSDVKLRDRISKRYLAYFVIAGIYIFLRATTLNFADRLIPASSTPLYLRLLTMSRVVFSYIRLLFLPVGLHMAWEVLPATSLFNPAVLSSLMVLILIFLIVIRTYRYSKPIFFASLWFFIALIPSSNLVPFTTYLAEHWLYLPSIGFFMILATIITKAIKPGTARPPSLVLKGVATSFLILALAFYSLITIRRNTDWVDNVTIFQHTLRHSPRSHKVHNNLGVAYYEKGLLDEALDEFRETLRLRPGMAEAYSNRGLVYEKKGMLAEAIDEYKEALRLKPHFGEAHNNLAVIYEKRGQLEEAMGEYKEAIRLSPSIPKPYNNLGVVYEKRGLLDEAIAQYKEALRLHPEFAEARKNLGIAYYKKGLFHLAREEWERVLRINADYPHVKQRLIELEKLGY